MKKIYLLLFMVCSATFIQAQTTLISPIGDGGFESGATLALNNWTSINHTTNTWQVGAASTPFAGARAAFVSNDGGTTNSYTNTSSQTSHFYRDITFPSGETKISLSFQWKNSGESGFDRILVYTAPTTVTPVVGVPISSATAIAGATLVSSTLLQGFITYQTATISLPASFAGTTQRIIFTWQNDGSGGTNPPASIDNISLTSAVPTNISSTGTGGLWSATTTWVGGVVPDGGDNATIVDGATVTIDMNPTVGNLIVGGGASGILEYSTTTARTLTVGGNGVINTGGTFRSNLTGTVITHVLSAAGNITNSGTLDFSTNINTAGAIITFTGAADQLISGTGATTDLFSLTMSKSALVNLVDFNVSNFSVRGLSASAVGALLTSGSGTGTIKFSGTNTFSGTLWSTASYTISSTLGFWLNNANFTVQGQNGSPTNSGTFRISAGTLVVGTSTNANSFQMGSGSTNIIEGGTINTNARFAVASSTNAITFNQSGGTIICGINPTANGNASTTLGNFDLGTSTSSNITISGGTVIIRNRAAAVSGPRELRGAATGAIINITGGTIQIGDASTPASPGIFIIQGIVPNFVVNATNNPGVSQTAAVEIRGDMTLNGTGTYTNNFTGLTIRGNSVTNPGNLTVNTGSIFTINSSNTSVLTFSSSFGNQTLTLNGTGSILSNQLPSVTINNSFATGTVTIPTGLSLMSGSTLTLTAGTLNAGAAGAGTISLGTATVGTFSCTRSLGALAAATSTYGAGVTTKSYTYNGAGTVTTGAELTTNASVTIDNLTLNNATANVTLNKPVTTGTFTLTNGILVTTSTNILNVTGTTVGSVTRAAGLVSGPMTRNLPASLVSGSTYLFPVGKGTYNPLELVNPTTNAGGTVTVQAEVFDSNAGGTAGTNMGTLNTDRYWASSVTSGAGNFTNTFIKLTDASAAATSAIASSSTLAGAYDIVGGSSPIIVVGTSVTTVAPAATSLPGFYVLGVKAVNMSYVSSTTTQAVTTAIIKPATNQQMIGVQIVTTGNASPLTLTSMDLNTTGSTAPAADISNARVYYTGTSSTFATTLQFGADVPTPSTPYTINGSQLLAEGTNYFWLVYDVPSGATVNNVLDAECTSINVGGAQIPTVTAPAGTRVIKSALNGVYSIGASQVAPNYTTLTNANTDLGLYGVSGAVTFQLMGDYNSASETYPLVINAFTGASATNTLTIKPASGVTSTITGSVASGAVIKLNGADYVTIDGSNNGSASKNLTITNNNTATSGNGVIWLASATASDGATNNTVKNCIITGNAETTTQMGIFSGGTASISTTTSALIGNVSNTIQNNTVSKAQYGVFVRGVAATTLGTGLQIVQNKIGTATAGDGFLNTGITVQFQDGAIVSNNEIQNQNNATVTSNSGGIILLDTKNGTVNANDIHFLRYTGASTGKIVGIHTSSATYNVVGNPSNITFSNNIIYDLNSTATSSSWNTSGISNNGGYNDKYYYNSVYLTGQMSNTGTAGSACFANGNGLTSTNCPVVDMRNNIFYMNGSSAAAATLYAHYTTVTTYSGSTLNYNDLLSSASGSATAQLGRFNATNYATLATWQTATGMESNSISGDPKFISATNLHINTAVATPVESAGTPIAGITTDFDNDARNATTPDIGADEGTFIAPLANDMQATAFISPVNGGSVITGASFTPQASFTNNGTATQTNVTVRYRIVDATLTEVYNNTQVITSIASGVTTTVTFASTSLASAGTYTIYAKAELVGDQLPANDEINGTLIAAAPLCGTYMVGASQPAGFQNLTQAIGKLNTLGVSCAVVFELQADYSSTGETIPLTINSYAGASSANTFTIKPASGVTASISGSSTSAIFILNGADYVTINGSNSATANTVCPVSAASRNLTITNANVGTSSAVVWLQTTSGTDAATNNNVINSNLVGNSNTTTLFGVGSGSATISTSSLGTGNNNNSFVNNNISKTQYGIFTQGASAANKNTGTIINQNIINTVTPNNVQIGGIYVGFDNGASIVGNSVAGMNSGTDAFGISTGVTSWVATTTTGNEVSNATISKNIIGLVQNTGTNSAAGILVGPSATGTNQVSNNMVYGVISNSTPGDLTAGIFAICGVGGTQVYYNSVSMSGDRGTGTTASSVALAVLGTDPTIDIRNNILVNKQFTASTGKSYAIGFGYSTFVNLTSNYNDFFTSGTSSAFAVTGTLNAGTDRTSLALLQTATGKDANSINVDPVFVSATDLHLNSSSNSGLVNLGTPISVTDDIDCATRDGVNPEMGADELFVVLPITIDYFRGSKQATSNVLDWKVTCTTEPSISMSLERSADGRNFRSIQDQTASNARCLQGFNYVDATPLAGYNYYRLKTVTLDGKVKYSSIVVLLNKEKGFELISIAPNPVQNTAVLSLTTVKGGKIELSVSDIAGKVISKQSKVVIAGNNPINMNFASLSAGTYIITAVNADGEIKTTRFVKL